MAGWAVSEIVAVLSPNRRANGMVPFQWYTVNGTGSRLPGVGDFYDIALSASGDDGPAGAAKIRSAAHYRKLQQMAHKLALHPADIGPQTLCETFTDRHGQQQYHPFMGVKLHEASRFIFSRGSSSVAAGPEHVRFVTGPCLFSSYALETLDTFGARIDLLRPHIVIERPVASIRVVPDLSLYELESCVRYAQAICDLVTALPHETQTSITIDVPRVQYYFYLVDAYMQGSCSLELLYEWIRLVDERHEAIVQCLEGELANRFALRGHRLPALKKSLGLEPIRELVLNCIKAGRLPDLPTLLDRLAQAHQGWRLVRSQVRPQTLPALADLSYAVELLMGSDAIVDDDTLVVSLEDRSEIKIYEAAQRLWRSAVSPVLSHELHLMGMYPLARVFLAGRSNWSLYLDDPGQKFYDGTKSYSAAELLIALYDPA